MRLCLETSNRSPSQQNPIPSSMILPYEVNIAPSDKSRGNIGRSCKKLPNNGDSCTTTIFPNQGQQQPAITDGSPKKIPVPGVSDHSQMILTAE